MRQAQINVRTRACSRTSIARTKQAALTHNVRGKELKLPGLQVSGCTSFLLVVLAACVKSDKIQLDQIYSHN